MQNYMIYWKPTTVLADEPWPRIMHSASDQYGKLRIGDRLWIVTSEGPGDLVLIGRQRVDRIVGQDEAERITGTIGLWEAEYHVISDDPEEKAYLDVSKWATQLLFDGVVDCLPTQFTGQHLQSMRRIESGTAIWLEKVWNERKCWVDAV